jgi:hypothetical protein
VHYPARHNGWEFLAENKDGDDSDGEDDDCPPLLHPSKRKRGYKSDSDGDSEMELANGEDDLDAEAKPIPASIDLCTNDDDDTNMVNSVNSVKWSDQHSDEEWLVDSGATVNMTRSDEFLENVTVCTQTITVGNGKKVRALTQGDLTLREKNTGLKITIHAMVCKEFPLNILSTKKLLQKGHIVTLNNEQGYIECKYRSSNATTKLNLTRGTDGMYYLIGT